MMIGIGLATAAWATVGIFYAADTSGLWELLKLLAQFSGALIVAYLTVRWALTRFKSEKTWERQSAALADVFSALREMERVKYIEYSIEIEHREPSDQYVEKLRSRYSEAEKKFYDVAAIAVLVLPTGIAAVIEKLEDDLKNGDYGSRFEQLDAETYFISTAVKSLRSAARSL
jgi:hypothetical protein